MTLTLLLDLDDTLLSNSMESFLPGYLHELARSLASYADVRKIAPELMAATSMMLVNQQPDRTLEEVFDSSFYPALGIQKKQVAQAIDSFYAQDFPHLSKLTAARPQAICLVEEALARGYRVAIATAPLFPRTAILERLRWAGLSSDRYAFALVPDYSSFHFAKPNPAYFAEFLAQLGWPDGPVLMVGDDYAADICGAQALGLPVFWVKNGRDASENNQNHVPQGEIEDLLDWIDQQPEHKLKPHYNQPQSLCAILRATPAALSTLSQNLPGRVQHERSLPHDWAPIEIICHLRDVENEINLPRLEQSLNEDNPFIAARDAEQWAESRKYLEQDNRQALTDFARSRTQLVNQLETLQPQDWQRSVRHAIFGPTTLLELVQFMADHDRLHIQQFIQAKQN